MLWIIWGKVTTISFKFDNLKFCLETNTAKFSIPLAKNIPGGNGPTAVEGFSTSGRILSIGPTSSSSSTAGWMPVQRTGASIKATPTGSFQGLICSPEEKAK